MELVLGIIAGIEFVFLAGALLFYYKKNVVVMAEKRDLLRFIINLAVEMIQSYFVILDSENRITSCSNSLAEMIRAESQKSLLGLHIDDLTKQIGNQEIVWSISAEIKQKKNIDKVYEFKHGQSGSHWIKVKTQQIMLNGKYGGILIFCSDITQETEGKAELVSLVNLRERILMAISHELKTPLNAIAGSIDMLSLSKGLGENEERHIKNIKEAYRTLVHRVDEITEYSNIKKNELTVENKEFVLQEVFDIIRNTVYIRTYEKNIGFRIDISPEIPAKLCGDVEKISSVLLHLLLKSAERTVSGFIGLSIKPVWRDGRLFLNYEIIDTASPVSQEEIKEILEYDIEERVNYEAGEPFAVGITISREYIKAMGGELKIENTGADGNRAWFELETEAVSEEPAASVQNPEEKAVIICSDTDEKLLHGQKMLKALGIKKAENYSGKENLTEMVWSHIIIDGSFKEASEILKLKLPYPCKKILILEASCKVIDGLQEADIILYEPLHVFMIAGVLNQEDSKRESVLSEEKLFFKTRGVKALVVDDNPVNIMVCSNILKQYGIETDEAESGIVAVQKYYTNDYDVIIMDYMMPGMDGIETTKKMRAIQKKSKEPVIIVLSANITAETSKQFKLAGAQEMMSKPMELSELSRALRRWLSKEQIIENLENQREQEKQLSEETFYTVLQGVKGLNIEAGLNHVLNSMETYSKVLGICCNNVAEQINHIKAGHKIVSPADLKINFHSLKGIFANVGADGLAEKSKKLELAAGESDSSYLEEHIAFYIEEVECFVQELESALNLYKDILDSTTQPQEVYISMEPEKYKEQVEKAKEAVRQYEFMEITGILEELVKASRGKERDILEKALEEIGEFQYDAVLELLEEI